MDTGSGAVMHVPKPCVSKQKDVSSCRFPIRSFLQTWPKKKWQDSSSSTTMACARHVLHGTSLAHNIITDHCPDLTKKQLHTMNGFESCSLFLFLISSFFSLLLSSVLLLCCVCVDVLLLCMCWLVGWCCVTAGVAKGLPWRPSHQGPFSVDQQQVEILFFTLVRCGLLPMTVLGTASLESMGSALDVFFCVLCQPHGLVFLSGSVGGPPRGANGIPADALSDASPVRR